MGLFSRKKEKRSNEVQYIKPYSSGLFFGKYDKRPYINLSGVYAATEIISNAIATLPINVKQRVENKRNVIEHRLSEMFYHLQTSKFNFMKQIMWDMLLHGNAYVYIHRQGNVPQTLTYLDRTAVTVHYIKETGELYYLVSGYKGIPNKVYPSNMLHFYKNSNNGFEGRGVLSYAENTLSLANSTESAAEDYFNSGCNIKGILKFNRGIIDDEQKQAIRSSWNEVHGGSQASGLAVLEGDAEFIPVSQNASDSQMLETRLYNIQDIARYFCISPVLLQDLSHSSYSTVEAMNIQFVQYTLMPFISLLEDELNRKLVTESDISIDLEESTLMKGNSTDMANYTSTLVNSGIMSINEARQFFGLNPMTGCDDLIIPYTDINQNKVNQTENILEQDNATHSE